MYLRHIVIFMAMFISSALLASDNSQVLLETSNTALAKKYVERARRKKEKGDIDGAYANFQKAVVFDRDYALKNDDIRSSDNAKEWIKKSKNSIYIAEKINCYKRAIKSDPAFEEGYERLGKAYYKQKNYKEAKAAFENLLVINPENKKAKKFLKKIDNRS